MVLKYSVNMLVNLPKMLENYLSQQEKIKKNLETKVQSIFQYSMKLMRSLDKEEVIIVEQVTIYYNLAARDDVVNQLLTNLDGV